MIRLQDIADMAGVSRTTVSNVINGNTKRVSQETIDKITRILKEQNYVPHMGSVMLSGHGSRIIGVVLGFAVTHGMQALQDSFVGELVGTIQTEAERNGYFVMLIGGEKIDNVVDMASRWNVEGLIILGYDEKRYHQLSRKLNKKMVLIDAYPEGEYTFQNVGVDDYSGGYQVGEYLYSCGYRKALFVAETDRDSDARRWMGFKQAMEKNSEAEQKKDEPAKDFGFITIAPGSGIAEIFKGLGVDEVIEGGQTMNPSTEDILNAADKINAKTIYVLPNNSNIILAANQAASIVEDKELIVIPTKTVPQGITAMINFETTRSAKDNGDAMTDSLSTVKSGQLTYAVRDTSIDGKEIKKDNYLGLGDKGLAAVGTDMDETLLEMIESMMSDEAELISVYYGADVEEAAAEAVVSKIEEKFPDVDVELQFGGQPVYYYIVSVE